MTVIDAAGSAEAVKTANVAGAANAAGAAGAAAPGVYDYMIEAKALTKRFDGFAALDGMDLHVPKGSVYGLVGPNGAGKTTLIRHLAGVYRPDMGEVRIDGGPVWENPHLKERLIHIPDDLHYTPSASISSLVAYYKYIYPRFSIDRFERLKAAFPLDLKKRVGKFSKGMQKQTALWFALCCMPDVMLLDEPVDGLDPVARRIVWSLILKDVAERRTTVLISSHNLRELDGISDHIGIMRGGRLILERALADLQGDVTKLQIVFAKTEGAAGVAGAGGAGGVDGAGVATYEAAGTASGAGRPFRIPGFEILHSSHNGRLAEYIVRGSVDSVLSAVNAMDPPPLLADAVPLTLEEIFIYELGGMDYAELI